MAVKKNFTGKQYDLLIIGGGPAGLTAAAYAIRKRIETMLISEDLGGKTNYQFTLPNTETHNIIDGQELVSKFKSQLEYLDFARHMGKVTKLERAGKGFMASTEEQSFKAKTAIIATGISPKRLNVPGEKEFLGHGLSYSTVSHAHMFIDKEVAVVGDGMPALQAAAELAQIAKRVNVIGVPNKDLGSQLGRRLKESRKAEFFSEYKVKEIRGTDAPEKVLLRSKSSQTEISVSGVFVELGFVPNTALLPHAVKKSKDGRVVINENNQTSIPGLFAAGDVTDVNAQQVVIAIGEGANAALSVYSYLLTLKT
jgi:alkyl hydroperoxide reductase subunit F